MIDMQYIMAGAVPAAIAIIISAGLLKGVKVFEIFFEGAADALKIALRIGPTLIGLITAINMLQASGALDLLVHALAPVAEAVGMPKEVMPLVVIRPISGGGAMAVAANLFKQVGPDSLPGFIASVLMGSSETTLYTIALYYGSVRVDKTRYTFIAAFACEIVVFIASAIIGRYFFGLL